MYFQLSLLLTTVLVTITLTILASHISSANANAISSSDVATKRVKRMYALCPPHFERVGSQCYYISDTEVNWLDAHFACKDRNSRLAEPIKAEDHRLRRFMMRNDKAHTTKWIGGMYNWQKNQWQWGYSGRPMDYQSFSQMVPGWVSGQIKNNIYIYIIENKIQIYILCTGSCKVYKRKYWFLK